MTFRLLALVAAGASLAGCATQPAQVHEPATSLLIGAHSSSARVLIKNVDDGPTLWSSPGVLTSKATIRPGHHKIEVVCESEGSLHFVPGDVTLDVQPGHTYELTGSIDPGATTCNVSAASRS